MWAVSFHDEARGDRAGGLAGVSAGAKSVSTSNSTAWRAKAPFVSPPPRDGAATSTATYSAATSLSSLRATQAQNPGSSAAPLGADGDPPPGTNESMLRAQLDYARALDFDNATLEELSEAVAALGEIRDIARQVLGSAHPDTVNMENLLQEAQDALAARQAPPPPPGSA